MSVKLTKNDLRAIAAAAASNGNRAWATLDYSAVANVGDLADYSGDLFGVTLAPKGKQGIPVTALDPANDTPDTAKLRDTLRKRALNNLTRNARLAHDNDKLRLALYWATVAAPTKDDKDATRRVVVIERTA